jgi:hypothetical protein
MAKTAKLAALLAAASLLAACGAIIENGDMKIRENGEDIVSIGRDGFKLNGNVTGLKLDSNGLNIEYPNGSIRIAGGEMVIEDKDGKTETLDATGQGAEYKTDGGVLVKTGKKASIPGDFPSDKAPLMDGFTLDASAELGSVEVVSGYVPNKTVDDAVAFYQPLLINGSSYSHDKKENSAVLKAKLGDTEITVYLMKSLTADAVNVSIIISR